MKSFFRRLINRIKTHALVQGTIIKCESGRYIAYYEHRPDIIANGESESDAKNNLKSMYDIVKKFESSQKPSNIQTDLPPSYQAKKFTEKLNCV